MSEFSVNRARKDCLQPYCKECCGRRTREANAAKHPEREAHKVAQVDPLGTVYSEIQKGPKTREQTRAATKLSFDEVGDALVTLVWECKVVKTEGRKFVPVDCEIAIAA